MKLTPMLEQYFEIKREVPDAILFYRLGDFYEMFFEDAERAAPILDLVLTARGRGGESETPMCGVPFHAVDQYIAKLIRHGFRVAICEQTGDAAAGKGLVKRAIVRIVTPGTAVEGALVDRDCCYLLALAPGVDVMAAAWLDASTGELFVSTYTGEGDPRLFDDIARLGPREVIVPRAAATLSTALRDRGVSLLPCDDGMFGADAAATLLIRHFHVHSLRGFGLEEGDPRIAAAGAAMRYAAESHRKELGHVVALRLQNDEGTMLVDSSTLQNLEVLDSRDGSRPRASLWGVIHATRTAMGSRNLRKWLTRPLRVRDAIFARHDAVDELTRTRTVLDRISETLMRIADLERLASRIALRSASPRECLALASSLAAVGELREACRDLRGPLLGQIRDRLDPLERVQGRIVSTLDDVPAPNLREGGVIRAGINSELDALRSIARDSKSILLQIEAEERTATGIGSLKIRFNSVFGYYIEISKSNLARVPPDYIRKQTLVNAERYITPRLKELEEKITGAEGKSIAIEVSIYEELLTAVSVESGAVLATAQAVAELDTLACFASVAIRNRYVRASLSNSMEICIEEGRHPVIETLVAERFIPNDTSIVRERNGIQLITGPNMGGKSTYLRQVALIVLLNQAGSFVPASSARLGLFDRIFTRVGASDQLARGESTFMVEMNETANILNNATEDSLIILDEVGRGTATFDGLSLAWAIIEYLHDTAARSAITLFATHYHEVTDLAKTRPRVANSSVAVKEWNDQIIFLRKVVPGAADKSYGIHVAKLAGIPLSVVRRAREILGMLEKKELDIVEETRKAVPSSVGRVEQLTLFASREGEVVRQLRSISVDELTPIDALNKLNELKRMLAE